MKVGMKFLVLCSVAAAGIAVAANVIISPNMGLPVPIVGTAPGPEWANDINASLSIIDSHDHTAGHGVPVPPAGININSDLPFVGNNATQLRSARFSAQGSPLAGASDLGALYVSGVDLYYNDESGNQVRMTQGGSVTGSSGTITGLPSGTASASFAAGTFTFQGSTNTPANMAVGPLIIGANTASPHTVTVAPPGGLAANYALTLPTGLPASTSILTVDASGNMASTTSPSVSGGTLTGTLTSSGGSLAGSFGGNPTFSGDPTFSGTTTFSGSAIFSGTPTIGAVTLSGAPSVFSGMLEIDGSGADTTGLSVKAGTTTGTIRQKILSGSTAQFEIDANFGSSPNVLSIQSDTNTLLTLNRSGTVAVTSGLTVGGTATITGATSINSTGGNVPHTCTNRTNTAGTASAVSVDCSAGEILMGGGCLETGAHILENSYPTTSTRWQCNWDAASTTIVAYGICCRY
ncbi:MAG: hypothetical protein V4641_10005 [Pseudomonadota bacterium]